MYKRKSIFSNYPLLKSKQNCQEGEIISLVSNMNQFIFHEISHIECHFASMTLHFYKIPDTKETVLEQLELYLPLADFVSVVKNKNKS